ncbi:hypothetical protein LCGC14_0541790 [marine sediment metagenome]|uniref:Uncharacterized protein n=1 Tax=marine sediment metagenome TaxID=412755 RepID=A0A0F9SB30_9ZZZZ
MARKNRDQGIQPGEDSVKNATEAKKDRNKSRRVAKRSALLIILAFVVDNDPKKSLATEVALLTPGQRMGGGGPSKLKVFVDLFIANSEVNGLQIYQDFGIGQSDMRKIARNLIKRQSPEKRIWVHYDKASDTYSVKGVGSEPPEGWTGYRPVEVDDVEII